MWPSSTLLPKALQVGPTSFGRCSGPKTPMKLAESMRDWVDPCNNFLIADVHGNSGYLCRGRIPIRSMANAWLPVPGWTGEHEWRGQIPFDELPRSLNPEAGYLATANNRPVGDDYPYYIAVDFTPEFRAKSVTEGLLSLDRPQASDMDKVHAQRVSIPALTYIELLRRVDPLDDMSARAREKMLGWSGSMDAGRVEPAIYSACRDALLKDVMQHNLGLSWSRKHGTLPTEPWGLSEIVSKPG